MKSRAQTYLASAVLAAGLIVAAVVAFVPLVSLQTFQEWPISGIVGDGNDADDSGAKVVEARRPVPKLEANPDGESSVAGGGATLATDKSGEPRRTSPAEGERSGGLAARAGGTSPASTHPPSPQPPAATDSTPVANLPSSQPPATSTPPPTSAEPPGSDDDSNPGKRGKGDGGKRAADPSPVSAMAAAKGPSSNRSAASDSGSSASSENSDRKGHGSGSAAKGKRGGARRTTTPSSASVKAVGRGPKHSPPASHSAPAARPAPSQDSHGAGSTGNKDKQE